ncbi:MAG: amidohydrolase family protein [Sphingomonadaceae bacterium]
MNYPLPELVKPYAGQIMDTDAHEATPLNFWREQFGSVVDEFVDAIGQSKLGANAVSEGDLTPITAETVFHVKRDKAPGAFDFKRRVEVLDFTGVNRQLMFPGGMGLLSAAFLSSCDTSGQLFSTISGDRKGYAVRLVKAYNDWCGRVAAESDRLRPVAILIGDTVDDLVAEAKRLLDMGVRGFWFPSDTPPAGLSPAALALDPLWALLADADAPALAHTGSDERFYGTLAWRKAEAFEGWKAGEEFSLDPWTLCNMHLATQNFLVSMVMGGVFERHPRLRYGACEVTAQWIGTATDNMDMWHGHSRIFSQLGGASPLKKKPSEYVRSNVRVSCFEFEDVGAYINRYGMPEVYCYASDYPHPEGGKTPIENFADCLSGQPEEVRRQFFVTNGELLMPD